jgi:hypothetical protein
MLTVAGAELTSGLRFPDRVQALQRVELAFEEVTDVQETAVQ